MMYVMCVCVSVSYILLVTITLINCFNLSWRHARVFTDPSGQSGSYFGYTVALRVQNYKHWLVVGAPRGNSTYAAYRYISQPGVTYQCDLDSGSECQSLLVDPKGNVEEYKNIKHKKDNAWLGGSLAVQNNDAVLVVCAPKWINQNFKNHYLLNGLCYWSDNTVPQTVEMKKLLPFDDKDSQSVNITTQKGKETVYLHAFGQAGFSAHIPKNSTELLLGAPGVFDWRGTIVRYKDYSLPSGNPRRKRSSAGNYFAEVDIPKFLSFESRVPMHSYLGYSLSSGRFFSNSDKLLYVSGAPRGGLHKGVVYVFDFPEHANGDFDFKVELTGTQMGEYFGGALCVVDLDGNGLDDLVVAAPQYSLPTHNSLRPAGDEGRIYVFINKDQGRMQEITENTKIMGQRQFGARFGTAVANLGDLNKDGYEDIAVGAPYEGNGVMYIYHGQKNGINLDPSQIIKAEDINSRIKGLGISFSNEIDIDGNHYNDVAVGAYVSGHVIVLRSHPVITFQPALNTSTNRLSLKTVNFHTSACLGYTGAYVPHSIDVLVTMLVDVPYGRATFVMKNLKTNNHTYNNKLQIGKPICQEFEIEIKPTKDPTKPIEVTMMYDLVHNPNANATVQSSESRGEFCKDCAVVDLTKPRSISVKVPFETGCKREVCDTDLSTTAEIIGYKNKFILGEESKLKLSIVVKNKGEPAFQARVKVKMPSVTPLVRIPSACQKLEKSEPSTYTLECDIGSPLEKNATLQLEVNAQEVPLNQKSLNFVVNASSVGNEVNPDDNIQRLTLPIVLQADMIITGKSSQEQLVYVTQNKTFRKDLIFEHTFEVWNLGPSRVDLAVIEFKIPTELQTAQGPVTFMDVLEPKSIIQTPSSPVLIECKPIPGQRYATEEPPDVQYQPFDPDVETIPGQISFNEPHQEKYFQPLSKRSVSDDEYLEEYASTLSTNEYSSTKLHSPPANRTLFLNCTDSRITCLSVRCLAGPFIPIKYRAVVKFPMKAYFELLDSELDKKDIILFSTEGKVTIESPPPPIQPLGHRPDNAIIQTMFLGKIPEGSVASWIIAVAIICGILILLLIVTALHKMGFFKRDKKEELQALKEAEVDSGDNDD